MVTQLNINTTEIVDFTNKLEKIHRAALPNAVRSTLNDLAFDVKTKTLQDTTSSIFIKRKPSFFRAFSSVDKATGFNVRKMKSTVGMRKDRATDGMDSQEKGGAEKRQSMATDKARVSNEKNRLVSKRNKLKTKRIVKTSGIGNKKQQFIRAAIYGFKKYGRGVRVMSYNGISRIDSLETKRKFKIKSERIYSFRKNRTVQVEPTHFMEQSALKSTKRMHAIFIKNAKFQIKKWTR